MQTLEQIIENHRIHNRVGELKKMQSELQQVIDYVHEKVEKMLDRGVTPVQEKKNLKQAQDNFALIEKAIKSLK